MKSIIRLNYGARTHTHIYILPTHLMSVCVKIHIQYIFMRPRIAAAAAITRSVHTHTDTQGISWSCQMLVASDKKLKYESFYHHRTITLYIIYPPPPSSSFDGNHNKLKALQAPFSHAPNMNGTRQWADFKVYPMTRCLCLDFGIITRVVVVVVFVVLLLLLLFSLLVAEAIGFAFVFVFVRFVRLLRSAFTRLCLNIIVEQQQQKGRKRGK